MTPIMSMIGMSAGVDRCLSVLAHASDAQQDVKIVCSHFVAICGAFHSFLFKLAKKVSMYQQTRIIVVHHEDDSLCPWPPVEQAWEDI